MKLCGNKKKIDKILYFDFKNVRENIFLKMERKKW